MPAPRRGRCAARAVTVALCLGGALAGAALAGEFRSTIEPATVLFDAPSTRAKKIGLLGPQYPVEIIVNLDTWAKVRDATGTLAWVEKKALADRRTVVVRAAMAEVLASTDAGAPIVFKAEQGVLLELADPTPVNGMVGVRHRDGQSGFVRVAQVWGL